VRLESVPNAVEQARTAAATPCGRERTRGRRCSASSCQALVHSTLSTNTQFMPSRLESRDILANGAIWDSSI
jgi:hypothetical protein